MSYVQVEHLCKTYRIPKSRQGIQGAVKDFFHREYNLKKAVDDISFRIEKKEIVGFVGANGAGKSTTIKMMTGILYPDSGRVLVNGIIPYENRKHNARHIGVVFGQRSQLNWDLPVEDTFRLYQKLYDIPTEVFCKNRDLFTELLDMKDFVHQPARQLSLGQRMKANLALAFLHNPDIVYLDEPTIGLDVISKQALRKGILDMNRANGTTVMLATHDMGDIDAVCKRLIIIDNGTIMYDGSMYDFKEKYGRQYVIQFSFDMMPQWIPDSRLKPPVIDENKYMWSIQANESLPLKDAVEILLSRYSPKNMNVIEQSVEDIVTQMLIKGKND